MPDYMWFEGIPFPSMGFEKEIFRKIRNEFVMRDEDTVILTYPKSGTNWLVEIVCLIQTKRDPKSTQSMPSWVHLSWLETQRGYSVFINKEGPRLIKSHLPIHLFPRSLFTSKAKVIYLIRNPRDVLVSGYFFWGKSNILKNPESLGNYFEWFIKGNVIYGSWFEHTRGWLSMRESDNFLVLSYEDMKKDTRGTIEKICNFLGKKLQLDELDLVLKHSSFQVMKNNYFSNVNLINRNIISNNSLFFRTGTTGDWKNHFTVAQAETFDKIFQEKMAGFPPGLFPWDFTGGQGWNPNSTQKEIFTMSDYNWFEGIPFPAINFKKERLEAIRDKFVVRDEDTVILTYPKSGTNWMVEIVCLIQTKGDPKWIQSVPIWDRSPWIETQGGYPLIINKEGPRLITSHLPLHLFPKSFFSSKAKVIYLIRNPRDVLVSGYFCWGKTNLIRKPESLGNYFEWFLKGNVLYGSWFEHIRGWLSMRRWDNFLVLCYEDMKKDTRGTIEKICDFLGKKLEPDELDLVLKYSSFQAMKENNMSNYSLIPEDVVTNGVVMMRKGTIGDWKNHITVAQAEAFDKVFQEKMAGFPPGLFPWE